mmetsp:Transcript_92912/g.300468  ORF Transcript_92912/g.300468 Transcript_92912/m.300468 type:complete len:462 (-) Transcript_92912:7-1392(-)
MRHARGGRRGRKGCVAEARVGSEHLDLVVKPAAGLRAAGFPGLGADGVRGAALAVEARTAAAAGQHLGAAVALARRLQPVVGVHEGRRRRLRGRGVAGAHAAGVAPAGAVGAAARDGVAACVDDDVRAQAEDLARRLGEALGVVQLIVAKVPLRSKAARVCAAGGLGVPAVQAVTVPAALVRLPGAELADRLIVGHVRGKATHTVKRKVHFLQHQQVLLKAVGPAEPAPVGRVQVYRRVGLARELFDGVLDARPVSSLSSCVPAVRVLLVGRQVGQAVRLDDDRRRHLAPVLPQQRNEGVHVLLPVLTEAVAAIGDCVIVASAIRVLRAADLAIRGACVAVAVGKIIPDEDHEGRRRLGGGVRQDALQGPRAPAVELRLHVDPVGRSDPPHPQQVLPHLPGACCNRVVVLPLVLRVHVESSALKRVRRGCSCGHSGCQGRKVEQHGSLRRHNSWRGWGRDR